MSSFATELSKRLLKATEFSTALINLQTSGAGATLPQDISLERSKPDPTDLDKLLYCASVFARSNESEHISIAQNIALNSALISTSPDILERASIILTELGNLPSAAYTESRLNAQRTTLASILQRNVIRELNSVSVGDHTVALTDYQKQIWNSLEEGNDLAISAPTSAGKSFLVIEYLSRRAIEEKEFTCVYIAPTRALLSEVLNKLKKRLENHIEIRISEIPSLTGSEKQVFVLTQERLQILLASTGASFDLIIVDEAQNLSDGSRGIILQECIEQAFHREKEPHIVFLAPGAEGFKEATESFAIPDVREAGTSVSPVLQNRIIVSKPLGEKKLNFKLIENGQSHPIGNVVFNSETNSANALLAAVAIKLGQSGSSLIYAKTPSEAATLAAIISQASLVKAKHKSKSNPELVEFIKDHIHPDYHLIDMVKNGVAFHYGQMPALLREAIEAAFKKGTIDFLVCTTTLFQGINLPARNVFINTPKRGRGGKSSLEPALLWNFAGRAGRMCDDIVGNVFLVDYESWEEKPLDEKRPFQIEPALGKAINHESKLVVSALNQGLGKIDPRDETQKQAIACAGLLVSKTRQGKLDDFILRTAPDLNPLDSASLRDAARKASGKVAVPDEILSMNWTLDIFALDALLTFFKEQIDQGKGDQLIPLSPTELGDKSFKHYISIFNLIYSKIKGWKGNLGGYVAPIAVRWMEGLPYPVIISYEVSSAQQSLDEKLKNEEAMRRTGARIRVSTKTKIDKNQVINKTFDTIESLIRFQLVQMGKAYIDLLRYAFHKAGRPEKTLQIFDFSMALELGISSVTGQALLELGLSRIAAAEVQKVLVEDPGDINELKKTLLAVEWDVFKLSPIILAELERLGLKKDFNESVDA
ncbi:DEAD/DEAH box helicase [Pseudomonas solani]|uniref:DEAD/DEAH box helicase n=1 Tax=Pseudomonas solani TaxID=2731552 RepID=A0AAU7XZH1_9PSED